MNCNPSAVAFSVEQYGRQFKNLCNKLSEIGRQVEEPDKSHWFLNPPVHDRLPQAQQYDLFLRTMEGSASAPAAFYSSHQRARHRSFTGRGSSGNSHGGSSSSNPTGARTNVTGSSGTHKPFVPRCQICRGPHFADQCPQFLQARSTSLPSTTNLAQAFTSSCNVTNPASDWYVDTSASAHMTSQTSLLDQHEPYSDKGASSSGTM
ncbi:unnamed protein product [Cuscuta europaea]|uniref:Uncharacterized protein n=1 Tax=Cuscuta europaea TaxID=41803 RepID=A0A9P0YWK2_CUSEU|nr:unnamed protein product [Cuscuta europaea]